MSFSRNNPPWSAIDTALLSPFVAGKLCRTDDIQAIATATGRTFRSVQQRLTNLRVVARGANKRPQFKADAVERKCSQCRYPFTAATRFIFRCNGCKGSGAAVHEHEHSAAVTWL